jgi:DNA adenine methylase Dam
MSPAPNIIQPIPATFDEVLGAIANEQKPTAIVVPAKPFLKWVGGKRSVLPELLARMPSEYAEYIEPFIGGGALFFAVQPHTAYLSDINLHLVLAYRSIRDNVEDLILKLKAHNEKHNKEVNNYREKYKS